MIRFPLTERIALAMSVPQGWVASVGYQYIELFLLTGQRKKISKHNAIRHREKYQDKNVVAFASPRFHWNERIDYWTPDGETTNEIEKAWTFDQNEKHSLKTLGTCEGIDAFMGMVVQHLSGVKEGLIIIKNDPFDCKIITVPGIIKAFMSHDTQTIFIVTPKTAIILDNPLI